MTEKHLKCEMESDCQNPVAYIDNKGFIYCEHHGKRRQGYRPCRKLRPHELNRLKRGEVLARY